VGDLTARGATGSFIHGGFELGGGSIRQGAALSFLDGTHHHVLRDGQMDKSISKSDNTIAIASIAWLDKVDTLVDLIEGKVGTGLVCRCNSEVHEIRDPSVKSGLTD
jgi:hypothetical protein